MIRAITILLLICSQLAVHAQSVLLGRQKQERVPKAAAGSTWTPASASGVIAGFAADTQVYSDAGTTPATTGQAVQQANDLTGHSFHWKSDAAAKRPTLIDNVLNGKPVLRFLQSGNVYLTNVFGGNSNQPIAMWLVCKSTNTDYTVAVDGRADGLRNMIVFPSATQIELYAGGADEAVYASYAVGTWRLIHGVFNSTSSYVRTNNVNTSTPGANSVGTNPLNGTTIGARYSLTSYPFGGDIAEFWVAIATSSDTNNITSYLMTKYFP